MKTLFTKLFYLFAPLTAIIVSTNYVVDPANLFSGNAYVDGIAIILAKDHNVDNIANYDQRLLQESLLKKISYTPDIIILGSSRVMEISSDFYPNQRLINCAVSHANINDIIAITGLLDSLHRLPKHLVIGVDPFLFSENGSKEWYSLRSFHQYAIKNILHEKYIYHGDVSYNLGKTYSLVSFDYFKESLSFLLQNKTKHYYDIGKAIPSRYGKFSDGSFCYLYSYTHPDTVKMASDARDDALKSGLPDISPYEQELLKKLLITLKEKGITIELVMIPYHNEYYTTINTKKNKFPEFEKLFTQLASDTGVPIRGSFNPKVYGLRHSDFYDRWHCGKMAIKKILI